MLGTALLGQPRLLTLYESALAALSLLLVVMIVRRIRSLRVRPALKLTPAALHAKLNAGDKLLVFDLRERLDVLAEPYSIPGAVQVSREELHVRLRTMAKNRPVVFYCTCPNEKSVMRMAATLRRNGFSRLWVLAGGIQAWCAQGLPVQPLAMVPGPPAEEWRRKVANAR